MKRKVLIASFLLTGILVGMMVSPSLAATTWGVEINERYEFTLKTFKFGSPTDISFMLKDNVTFGVEFTSFNDTGYTYDIYNSSGLMESGVSTLFEETETELGNITMPLGLPIAMPLAIGTSSDYLLEIGTIVNQTSIMIGSEDFVNLTEFGDDTVVNVYSLLDEDYLKLKTDIYTSNFNDSLLEGLIGGLSDQPSDFPIDDLSLLIPDIINEMTVNITMSVNAKTGLFDALTLVLKSKGEQSGFEIDFDVYILYGYEDPAVTTQTTDTTETTDTETTTEAPYSWLFITPFALVTLVFLMKKRRK